jgi:hypothetical protein
MQFDAAKKKWFDLNVDPVSLEMVAVTCSLMIGQRLYFGGIILVKQTYWLKIIWNQLQFLPVPCGHGSLCQVSKILWSIKQLDKFN